MKRFYTIVVLMVIFGSWLNLASAQNVEFPDVNLAAAVREALDLAPNAPITVQDLQRLTILIANGRQITNLTGLEHAIQLESLSLPDNQIRDLSPLAGLTQLTGLSLSGNQISDISPLAGLTQLGILYSSTNQISDVSPLAGLTQLEKLTLNRNQIQDVSPLAGLTQLVELGLWDNHINDISPLAGLTQLVVLGLSENQIGNIQPLAGLTQLKGLNLSQNQIQDVSPLAGLTQLERLFLEANQISDVSPLASLTRLWELWLTQNTIRDVSALAGLVNLQKLRLADNPITDTSPLASLTKLIDVDVDITTDETRSVSFSPDGSLFASGGSDGIKLWDVETQENIAILSGVHVISVSFSPDGTMLASGGYDGIKLWDVETKENIASFEEHLGRVSSVSFSPDGTMLAAASPGSFPIDGKWVHDFGDATVKIWDVETRENIASLDGHFNRVSSVSFSPDGTMLATVSDAGVVLWDVETLENIATFQRHEYGVASAAFSPDGSLFASAAYDIKLWDIETKENITTLGRHPYQSPSLSFSPDGSILASGSYDGIIKLWDVVTHKNMATFKGHTDAVISLSFSPDGSILASGSSDGTVKFSNVLESTFKLIKVSGDTQQGTFGSELAEPLVVEVRDRFNNPVQGVQVTFAVTAGEGKLSGQFAIEHATTDANGRALSTLTLGNETTNTVVVSIDERELGTFTANGISPYHVASFEGLSFAFSPDGSLLAIGSFDNTVQLWSVKTKENIATFEGHTDWVISVSFSSDGTRLASGSEDGVRLWDIETRENITTLEGVSASLSPDGSLLATGTLDNTVKLWDVETKENIATLEGHTDLVISVLFSPDGSLLASVSEEGVKLWNVATQENIATLEGHSISFSPDGSLLASATSDGIKLWDVVTKENIATLLEDTATAAVSFSPDGSLLAIGVAGGTSIWDMGKNSLIAFFEEPLLFHPDVTLPITSVSFSPDSSLLASGSYFSPGKLWNVASYVAQLEPERIAEDVNGDGVVNIQDLVLVASNLGKTGQHIGDVNVDEVVDIRDLVKVAGALGNAAASPSLHPQALAMFTAADVQKWLTQAQSLDLTDVTMQRGVHFLEQLLAALIPKETALLPNYPNPFNPETWIPYQLAKPADVTVTIYAMNGQVVRRLFLGHQLAGTYESKSRAAYWDGRNAIGEAVASGIYFYTFRAGNFTATRKMLIMK